jgi:hypothetical protein
MKRTICVARSNGTWQGLRFRGSFEPEELSQWIAFMLVIGTDMDADCDCRDMNENVSR